MAPRLLLAWPLACVSHLVTVCGMPVVSCIDQVRCQGFGRAPHLTSLLTRRIASDPCRGGRRGTPSGPRGSLGMCCSPGVGALTPPCTPQSDCCEGSACSVGRCRLGVCAAATMPHGMPEFCNSSNVEMARHRLLKGQPAKQVN